MRVPILKGGKLPPQFTKLYKSQTSKTMNIQPNSYPLVAGANQEVIQKFNKENGRYIQSFRITLAQGTTSFTPVLASSGYFFEGLSISLGAFTGIADTSINFQINSRSLLVDTNALILCPNYVQGNLLFYPLPQPLTGKDTFKVNFLKQDAGTVVIYLNLVYKPSL